MHEGHRKRMRSVCVYHGFDSMNDHQLLEMILGYSIPRRDTNPIAHALLQKFGSLRGVLQAEVCQLTQVEGVGEYTAVFLQACLEMARRCQRNPNAGKVVYDRIEKLADYFFPLFLGAERERIYAMFLDNGMHLLDCVLLAEGTYNKGTATVRCLTQRVYDLKVSNVVLAHNHPNGMAVPSRDDIEFTDSLRTQLWEIDVILVDHLIIAEDRFESVLRNHCFGVHAAPVLKKKEDREHFYDRFYENFSTETVHRWKL
ncbi:MAG: hypothetical protein IJX62_05135 [Clostridia bacterium]|nr:hypothetical protein [Clostridia bacterium]